MADTKTKPKGETKIVGEAPAPKLPATRATSWQDFGNELKNREREIAAMLPTHIKIARFQACAISAIKQNPDLLNCTPRSLFTAVTKAAQDGLLPDGREGAILSYRTKQKDNTYLEIAQWQPMIYGLRKRARELDNMLILAQVVYANDKFVWHEGDDPHIEHLPPPLGANRGAMLGAYAIFKREDGLVLHREVMSREQIETVQSKSRSPEGLMWKTFPEEAWRKTVARRGIKSVPVSEELENVARRDDEAFDFTAGPVIDHGTGTLTPPRPKKSDFERPAQEQTQAHGAAKPAEKPQPKPAAQAQPEPVQEEQSEPEPEEARDEQELEAGQEAETEAEQDAGPSQGWIDAKKWLDGVVEGLTEVEDLDEMKKTGQATIDSFDAITEDERDVLRGNFMQALLSERARRPKKRGK